MRAPDNRQAPHNLKAEQALLGAILVHNEALDRVSGFLSPDHFYDPLHGQIYDVLATMILAGKTATSVTLKTFFENAEPINPQTTVPQYLGKLAANATTVLNAADHGRTIYDLATRRALIVIGEDMLKMAYDSAIDTGPAEQIAQVQARIDELSLLEGGKKFITDASLAGRPVQTRDWVVEGAVPDKNVSMLTAGSGDVIPRSRGRCGATVFYL